MLGGGADRLCTPSTSAGPFRIFSVAGFQNRANDIVYCPPVIRQPSQNVEDSTAVVYFGGDVQDFPESMETNRDSRGYMKYNLENSAILLREAFPRSHIIVIRPVRMEFKTFSCFDNFVRGNNAGVPDHTPMNHALQHLEKLLQNLSQRLISIPENEIMDQAAQAAAAAVAVAALVSSTLSNNTTETTATTTSATITTTTTATTVTTATKTTTATTTTSETTTSTDNNQEMDIDILQVQEHVTDDSDGSVEMTDMSDNNGTSNAKENNDTISAETPPKKNTDNDIASKNANDTTTKTNASPKDILNNDTEHQNNVNNGDQQQIKSQKQQQQQQETQQEEANSNNPLWWRENLNLDKAKLVLIGFSKGCVVLNQFIYEFHYLKTLTPDDSTMVRLLSRIKDIYWLDGGHGGQKNTWITSRSLLETLTRMGINIHVHLTPYQVQDDRRPWIRKEEKIFTDMLRRLGAALTRHLHYDSQTANLMTHFEVLQAFCQHIHTQGQQAGAQANVDMINAEQNINNQNSERQDNAPLGNNTTERLTAEAANEEK